MFCNYIYFYLGKDMLVSASLLSNFVFIISLRYYFAVLELPRIKSSLLFIIFIFFMLLIIFFPSFILFFLLSSSSSSSSSRSPAPKHFYVFPQKKCLGAQTECPVGGRDLSKACKPQHEKFP